MGGEEQALAVTEDFCRIYVGNLLPKAKESHLTSKFARFGTIHSVWIARRPPGFAFVTFASPEAAQRAVEACEEGAMEVLGKAVRVQMAGDKGRKQGKRRESSEEKRERSRSPRRGRSRSRSRERRRSTRSGGRRDRRRRRSRSTSRSRSRSRSRRYRRRESRSSSRSDSRERRRRYSRSESRSRR